MLNRLNGLGHGFSRSSSSSTDRQPQPGCPKNGVCSGHSDRRIPSLYLGWRQRLRQIAFALFQDSSSARVRAQLGRYRLYRFRRRTLIGFGVADFSNLLEVQAEISGIDSLPALFLDEIQLIDGWEKFARRMADAKAEIYITGSDVRMRDLKIEETLGGRFLTENVFPLSFSEFLRVKGVENSRSERKNSYPSRICRILRVRRIAQRRQCRQPARSRERRLSRDLSRWRHRAPHGL